MNARRLRARWVSREDVSVRVVRKALRDSQHGIDVLFLGDSSSSSQHPDDKDARPLPAMVSAAMPDRNVLALHLPGWHAGVFDRILQLLMARDRRPNLIVLSLNYRQAAQMWAANPLFAYGHASVQLDRIREADGRARVRARAESGDQVAIDMEQFRALAHPSIWLGPRTNGQFLDAIRAAGRGSEARLREAYAYMHGEALRPDSTTVARIATLARRAQGHQIAMIAHENPVSVETGVRCFGPEFRSHLRRNLDVVSDTLESASGDRARVLRMGTDFPEGWFVDPTDGAEHYRDVGRMAVASELAAVVSHTGW